jgi:hypothetical protein
MADHDVEGHLEIFAVIWESDEWLDIWRPLGCRMDSFKGRGLATNMPDSELWRFCQENQIVLVTGNRNKEGDDSLEATMQRENTPQSLPVLTIADPKRVTLDRAYAESGAVRVLDYLLDLERFRGAMRLYVP